MVRVASLQFGRGRAVPSTLSLREQTACPSNSERVREEALNNLSRMGVVAVVLATRVCPGQSISTQSVGINTAAVAAARDELTALLTSFVKEAAESGLSCAIQPPKLAVEDVPSFGRYDPETNTLTSPAWEQMAAEEQAMFYRVAGPNAKELDARAEFELGVHHWVIVHELGHWWEACRGAVDHGDHYTSELEANRIAAAYWNEHDPAVNEHQQKVFSMIVERRPNPVPSGQTESAYFNQNYEELGPTPAYTWFQARMCLKAFSETPLPQFPTALVCRPRNT